jgi:hypothetical protein
VHEPLSCRGFTYLGQRNFGLDEADWARAAAVVADLRGRG